VKPATAKESEECVLLVADEAGEAARFLAGAGSATDKPVRVECVTDLSSGIGRLHSGGVGAVVLGLTFPDVVGWRRSRSFSRRRPAYPF
jgi:hypothetical protein